MKKVFKANLSQIQPSQLYISAEKLASLLASKALIDANAFKAVPVKKLGSRVVFTDGHTRAFALFQSGVSEICVYLDDDELDWEAYQICVDWCVKENICSIEDLKDRIISEEDYKILWLKRCSDMQSMLAEKRNAAHSLTECE